MTEALPEGDELLAEALQASSIAFRLAHTKPRIRVDGEAIDFHGYPFIPRLLDDDHPNIVILKGAQLGFTSMAVLKAIETMHRETLRGMMYLFPTTRDASDFSRSRFSRILKENPMLGDYVQETDAVGIKQISGAFAYFRGANARSGLKAVPVDLLIFDERDEMADEMVELADHRLDGSTRPQRIEFSTPTLPEYGVDLSYSQSDQHQWMIRCQGCGEYTCLELTFPDCFEKTTSRGLFYACQKCRGEIFSQDGEWVPAYPDRSRRGYAISQLNSPRRPCEMLHEEWERGQRTGRLREFMNSVLGRAWADVDDALTEAAIAECIDPAEVRRTADQGPTYMGIDPGPREFWYTIARKEAPHFQRVIDYGRVTEESHVLELMKRFNVSVCVCDAMAETRAVRSLQHQATGKIWGCTYSEGQKGGYLWSSRTMMVTVNRTESLDASHDAITFRQIAIPRKDERYHELLVPHWKNLARKTDKDDSSGQVRTRWVVRGVKQDHLRHAWNYALIASERAPIAYSHRPKKRRYAMSRRPEGFMVR